MWCRSKKWLIYKDSCTWPILKITLEVISERFLEACMWYIKINNGSKLEIQIIKKIILIR